MSDTILANVAAKTKSLEEQQLYAYTNFINYIINEEPFVHNILKDLKDGLVLIRLLRNLSGCDIPNSVENPLKDIEKIQNLSAVIQFAKDDGIKILSSAEEILAGDRKGILSFMYQILNKYRLGNCPVKMAHFAKWIKSSLKINNADFDLKKELSEGVLLAKLLNYLQKDIIDLKSLGSNHLENIQKCIDIGYTKLRVPKLVKAENIVENTVDDYCLYFYLTFFIMKETHFEDNEMLKKIAQGLRERKVRARNQLKNRLERVLKKMIDQAKNAEKMYQSPDNTETPEEAKTLIGMISQLEIMYTNFEKTALPKGYIETNCDLTNDPMLKELKEWESKINITQEIVRKLISLMNQKKRMNVLTPRRVDPSKEEVKINSTSETGHLEKQSNNPKQEVDDTKKVISKNETESSLEKTQQESQKEAEQNKKIEELQNLLAEKEQEIQKIKIDFTNENNLHNVEKKEKEDEILTLKKNLEEIKKSYEEERESNDKQNKLQKEEIQSLKREIFILGESKGDEVKKMKELMEEKNEEITRLRNQCDVEIQSLKTEIETLKKESETKELEKKTKDEEVLKLKQELNTLRESLEIERQQKELTEKERNESLSTFKKLIEEKDTKLMENEQTINQLEDLILNIKKEYAELVMKFNDREMVCVENETDKRVLFNSLALSIKMVLPTTSKFDNTMLYNECTNQKVPIKNWNIWLVNRLTKK
ncbi:calponin- domain containing family protein [Entamoeba histolytica HM-1:IMSS-B]|uniref:Calponin-homology domain containing protein n=5 Tax=Entamoeba histolytica TaxID=5759 RepID=A0A175JIA2_ENTHI|nr:alpha actinin-2, putative [Entamoeba histolytica KU27]EMH74658.1 calponin- domain containing family protein [Entamoeba histolytica HM-1:IMSS-B]EMS16252.1 alpha-actinin-2, putative [Entamoeba histolytica HM-3:IMSS]ENY63202.1 alpha-actinin-2, putative [Entamoeba histolytica HM-1:IMSS-A]GAT93196.1 calponin-homology domain containing protein [Entamoeba histolytica]